MRGEQGAARFDLPSEISSTSTRAKVLLPPLEQKADLVVTEICTQYGSGRYLRYAGFAGPKPVVVEGNAAAPLPSHRRPVKSGRGTTCFACRCRARGIWSKYDVTSYRKDMVEKR